MRYWVLFPLVLLINISGAASSKINISFIQAPKLIKVAKTLRDESVLRHGPFWYVYASVSNKFINTLYPILLAYLNPQEKHCLQKDPNFFGPHISLSYQLPAEYRRFYWVNKARKFYFTPVALKKVVILSKKYKTTWYALSVRSQGLLIIDRDFHVPRRYQKLHISIAKARETYTGVCL